MESGIKRELRKLTKAILKQNHAVSKQDKVLQKINHNILLIAYLQQVENYPESEEHDSIAEEKLRKFERALNIKTFEHQFSDYLG